MNLLRGFTWSSPVPEERERKLSSLIETMVCEEHKTLVQVERELAERHGFASEEAKRIALFVAPKLRMLSSSLGSGGTTGNNRQVLHQSAPVSATQGATHQPATANADAKRKAPEPAPHETKAMKWSREETLEEKLSRGLSSARTYAPTSTGVTGETARTNETHRPQYNYASSRGVGFAMRGGRGGYRGGGGGYNDGSGRGGYQHHSNGGGGGGETTHFRGRGAGYYQYAPRGGHYNNPNQGFQRYNRLAETSHLEETRSHTTASASVTTHKNQKWVRPGFVDPTAPADTSSTTNALNESLPSTP